jgi:8-oxo-dGTP pyrophosphatase MutT (NUDIX family)
VVPPQAYLAGLVRKRTAAGLLLHDRDGRVLLVRPSYKSGWDLPGGAGEADEPPWATAAREAREETGWTGPVGRLLVLDWVRPMVYPDGPWPEGLVFVFDGGRVDPGIVEDLVFADGEISAAEFTTLEQARERVKPLLQRRLEAAVHALDSGTTVMCEHGHRMT